MRISVLLLSVLLILAVAGCSGGSAPTVPGDNTAQPASQPTGDFQMLASGTLNLETGNVENDRNVDPYINVTSLVGSNFSFKIDSLTPPDILNITLKINNISTLTVNDVCIVFENLYGKTVMNPDSYMDIFLAGDIDPFIAFRKESPTRAFPPGIDTEQLQLKYPGGSPNVQYFIIAHLGGNTSGVYSLQDWSVNGTLTPTGGNATLSVSAMDWQNDVTTVKADTTALTGGLTTFTKAAQPNVWTAPITNSVGAPAGTYKVLVQSTSPASPAYSTYNYFNIDVQTTSLNPTVFGTDKLIANSNFFQYPDLLSAGHRGMVVQGNNFYLTFWAQDSLGTEAAVYFTKSTDKGATWSSAIALTSETDLFLQEYSGIAVGASGIYVVYTTNEYGDNKIKLTRSTDSGVNWTTFDVSQSWAGIHADPAVCINTDVNPEKVMVSFVTTGAADYVTAANATATNLNSWTFNKVSDVDGTGATKYGPTSTYNTVTDKFMLCWTDYSTVTDLGNRIMFDQSANGTTWGPDLAVSDVRATDDYEFEPSIAFHPTSGIPGIIYRHYRLALGNVEVRFVKATSSAATAFAPTVGVCDTPGQIFGCSLACESTGRWVAAWFYDPSGVGRMNCMFDESLNDGASWGTDIKVNDNIRPYVYNPVIATNGTDVCVAWSDRRSGNYKIYVDHGTH